MSSPAPTSGRLSSSIRAEPNGDPNRFQVQAAIQVGGALERASEDKNPETSLAAGFAVGVRYFNHFVLGPIGFGTSMQYWSVPRKDAIEDGDNFLVTPSIGMQANDRLPIDLSLGPVLGFSEPLPSSGRFEFTTGAQLQLNLGLPLVFGGPYASLDLFNLSLNFLARPASERDPYGGTLMFGINPVGVLNALFLLETI